MKKIFNLSKIIILSFFIFIIGDNNVFVSKSINNENLDKKVSEQIIAKNQEELLKEQKRKEYLVALAKKEEEKNKVISVFNGSLTGYTASCSGCSGKLACTGTSANSVYYNDKTFGTVHIVATSKKYPCGTILKFSLNTISSTPIIAIALDRGVNGNTVDLLSPTESYALQKIGRISGKKFEVLRLGW